MDLGYKLRKLKRDQETICLKGIGIIKEEILAERSRLMIRKKNQNQ